MNDHIAGAFIPAEKTEKKKEVKNMKHINAKSEKEITDSNIAEKMSDLGIPYVDIGESWKERRTVTKDGTIIDTVTRSGEPGGEASWQMENVGKDAIRRQDETEAARFKEHIEKYPLRTLE